MLIINKVKDIDEKTVLRPRSVVKMNLSDSYDNNIIKSPSNIKIQDEDYDIINSSIPNACHKQSNITLAQNWILLAFHEQIELAYETFDPAQENPIVVDGVKKIRVKIGSVCHVRDYLVIFTAQIYDPDNYDKKNEIFIENIDDNCPSGANISLGAEGAGEIISTDPIEFTINWDASKGLLRFIFFRIDWGTYQLIPAILEEFSIEAMY